MKITRQGKVPHQRFPPCRGGGALVTVAASHGEAKRNQGRPSVQDRLSWAGLGWSSVQGRPTRRRLPEADCGVRFGACLEVGPRGVRVGTGLSCPLQPSWPDVYGGAAEGYWHTQPLRGP
ncbi:hypothetical protein RR48_10443 [Papilio machaon]|uniref:Uncharacterized protein n=1 Tax=Papilio machaon TaxID=76193 RepID=A0A194R4S1_PAPMA|nr:hypothetical protein RR48_10443 [Papilio machaon]